MLRQLIVPALLLCRPASPRARLGGAGRCASNRDCSRAAPHCSDWGYCQWTPRFGSRPEETEDYSDYQLGEEYEDGSGGNRLDDYDYDAETKESHNVIVEVVTDVPKTETRGFLAEVPRFLPLTSPFPGSIILPIDDRFVAPPPALQLLPPPPPPHTDGEELEAASTDPPPHEEGLHFDLRALSLSLEVVGPHKVRLITQDSKSAGDTESRAAEFEETGRGNGGAVVGLSPVQPPPLLANSAPVVNADTSKEEGDAASAPAATQSDIFTKCPGDNIRSCVFSCVPLPSLFIYGLCVRECADRCPLRRH